MPRDYTSADFILRGTADSRERIEAVRQWQNQQALRERSTPVRNNYEEPRITLLRRRVEDDLSVIYSWPDYQERLNSFFFDYMTRFDIRQGFIPQYTEEELAISDPVLRKVASLTRRFKTKTLPKIKGTALPLPK